jgi:hypothetical protein
MECTLQALFPIPIPIPTPICRDLGVGVGIGIGIDFFLAESCSMRIAAEGPVELPCKPLSAILACAMNGCRDTPSFRTADWGFA